MRVWVSRVLPYGSYLLTIFLLLLAYPVAYAFLPQQESDIEDSPFLRNDPEKIVLSDRDTRVPCGECHTLEYDVWQETPHATGFDTMHRSKQAQGILERMDYRLSKRESLCLRCHYTATVKRDEARAIAGVSCESCHGAARDWLDLHNDYGSFTHESETPEHAAQRAQASNAAGMLRPSDNLYGVAANCFECHTVPSEELIDVGKHASGSEFELVEWSERIRHNFLQAQWSSDETNRAPTAERKRVMYVVGRMLDYEYSVRGMAVASTSGRYAKSMERRITSSVRELDKIAFLSTIPELTEVLTNHKDVQLIPNNREALIQVADRVRVLGQQFSTSNNGSQLQPIDRLIAGEAISLPTPVTEAAPIADATPPAAGTPPQTQTTAPTSQPAAAPSAQAPTSTPPTPTVQVVGEKRTRPSWFTSSKYDVTLANCGRCHIDADEALIEGPHYSSTQALHNESPRAVQIAANYGLTRAQMKQGNQICMQCHGTIATGQEASVIFDGVSCESCHGPSSEYLKPHSKDRTRGFALGMVELKNASVLAGNCSRCHLITDERLISSGHPSGSDYSVTTGIQTIKHWPDDENIERDGPYPEVNTGALGSAYASIVSGRPVPNVPVATFQPPPPQPRVAQTRSAAGGNIQIDASPRTATPSAAPRPPPTRPARVIPRSQPSRTRSIDLPEPPAVSDSTSTEDLLLLVKERLELLYKALGRNE